MSLSKKEGVIDGSDAGATLASTAALLDHEDAHSIVSHVRVRMPMRVRGSVHMRAFVRIDRTAL